MRKFLMGLMLVVGLIGFVGAEDVVKDEGNGAPWPVNIMGDRVVTPIIKYYDRLDDSQRIETMKNSQDLSGEYEIAMSIKGDRYKAKTTAKLIKARQKNLHEQQVTKRLSTAENLLYFAGIGLLIYFGIGLF